MKILVLSRAPEIYSTRRLVEAAQSRGHDVEVVDYLRCIMNIASGRPQVFLRGKPLVCDAIIPRIGASYTFYGAAVVRQFEMMGIHTANPSYAITRSRDKLRSLQLLSREGVGLPQTGFAHNVKDSKNLLEHVGGNPVVVKLLESTHGSGVVLAETKKAAESVIGAFRQLDANFLVQEFVKEANGEDVRAFVVGRRVVASMKRKAAPGEFRSNLHMGGIGEPIKLNKAERLLAIKAARVMGLGVAGVDLLKSSDGMKVLEVNSSPGLKGIEETSGKDIASVVIKYLEKQQEKSPVKRRKKQY